MTMECQTCRYWRTEAAGLEGWCHYDPPAPFIGKLNGRAIWPMTSATDFCSKWAISPDVQRARLLEQQARNTTRREEVEARRRSERTRRRKT